VKVSSIMMRTPAACSAKTNLGAAVEVLWQRNCGMLPVTDDESKVVGVVTDRDLCIALGTRNRLPGEVTLKEVITGKMFWCKPDDDVHVALNTMAREKVRRLPVINSEGKLEGILSMDDVVVHSEARSLTKKPELAYEDVVDTLKKIYETQFPIAVGERAAAA
jgi:CBS domain-containing protein